MSTRIAQLYLARRFLGAVGAAFLGCAILIFVIDFIELMRRSGKGGGVVRLIDGLWMTLLRLPAFTEMLITFAVLVGGVLAFMTLARKSELTVMRAAGLSVWQILSPCLLSAAMIGIFSAAAYNPLASLAYAEAERLYADAFGRDASLLAGGSSDGSWLRQDGPDGPSVMQAQAVADKGLLLSGVTVFRFDTNNTFRERIDAARALLKDGYWKLETAVVTRGNAPPARVPEVQLRTSLSPERAMDALGSARSISFWDLPDLIQVTEKAGLSTERYRVQYELLKSRPLVLMLMVLLAATVSLRSFRFGRIPSMVITGMAGGLGFFLFAEVSRQLGNAGLAPPFVAVWVPVLAGCFLSLTVLLHLEDG